MDGEAQWASVVYAPADEVWEQVSRFTGVEGWMGARVEICLLENGPCGCRDIGCRRRVVLRDEPSTLLREELLAYFESPKKRYYTYAMLPPTTDSEADRSLFHPRLPTDVRVTLSVSELTRQRKCFVEYYSTFSGADAETVSFVSARLEAYFKESLAALTETVSRHAVDTSVPDAVQTLLQVPQLRPYEAELNDLCAMWQAAVNNEHSAASVTAALRVEAEASRKIIDSMIQQQVRMGPRQDAPAFASTVDLPPTLVCMQKALLRHQQLVGGESADEYEYAMYKQGLYKSILLDQTSIDDLVAAWRAVQQKCDNLNECNAALQRELDASRREFGEEKAAAEEKAQRAEDLHAKRLQECGPGKEAAKGGGAAQDESRRPADPPAAQQPLRGAAKAGDYKVYPRRGQLVEKTQIEELFRRLDDRSRGYLTLPQLTDFYLSINVFETPETVQKVLKRYLREDETIVMDSFHSLMLNRARM
ncbi:hypothetical protein DIPPA_20773 [Diplonema papillatum]|nr:hypothetical protein DIPPA_20773 [Diplonema papillatum]